MKKDLRWSGDWELSMKIAAKNISKLLVTLTATTLWGCMDSAETETNANVIDPSKPVSDWQLVWSDEFDGSSIDQNKWTHEVNCQGGGNNEQQCYTDSADNSFVQDGMLHLVALPAEEGAEKSYTSARLNTKGKADFKYGRFEMRAKLPSGQGSWPAFWMLPTDEEYGGWPKSGEIDIVEAVNLKVADDEGNVESYVHGTLHYGREWPDNDSSGKAYLLPDGANPADEFHTYAIEWQEGEIRWYLDDYLYATQRQSEVRYNSKDEAVGLAHKGWYAEYFNAGTGELETHWDTAPFDQDFHMLLNFAVGGNWPENVNATGIDATAFENGQQFEVDYVRVYQCSINPETGEGCATVRGGYDDPEDAFVEGAAPIPSPPSAGVAQNLAIFNGSANPNWPAWDCCGGSSPEIVADDDKGNVTEFVIGAEPTVVGFISRADSIIDENGQATPFDASPMVDSGSVSFEMKVVTPPSNTDATWLIKIESNNGDTAVELPLTDSNEGVAPVTGEWQTYTFSLQALADAGLDLSAIDVVMIFPAWGTGEGAVFRVTNVNISSPNNVSPSLTVFDDAANASWPAWDCCGGSTPTVETDDAEHGAVTEFTVGAEPTVMGFISRETFITEDGATPQPFDATAILANGVIQFEMKVTNAPNNADAAWLFKVESNEGDTDVELPLSDSVEGLNPVVDQWQTYTFNLASLADAGLDVSAIDVLMIFPAWGAGEGAVYRVDNVKIYDPNASTGFVGHVLFADEALTGWQIWDCCGGSTPTVENDDADHGMTAEFVIGAEPTVMGITADDGVLLDASNLLANGVVQFEMKVVNAPNDASAQWLFKIESDGATTDVELPLTDSQEGAAPVVGEWQTYTYSVQSLFDAGLDISSIDVLMVFPAWGAGEGAVYRLDNIMIYDPTSVPAAMGLTVYDNAENTEWPMWDCCGGSTPTEQDDGAEHGMVAEFSIGAEPTVMGFLANDDAEFDASNLLQTGVISFDLKVVTAPTDSSGEWLFKVESLGASTEAEFALTASEEGVAPTVGEWQTYTFTLLDLFDAGLDISSIDVLMIFPTWGTGEGAVYRVDNVRITTP